MKNEIYRLRFGIISNTMTPIIKNATQPTVMDDISRALLIGVSPSKTYWLGSALL